MARLTDPVEMAELVSYITDIMCGIRFTPSDPLARGESLCGRMVMVSLQGGRPIDIVLSCDAQGSHALTAAMFRCPAEEVTAARVDDAIRELLNIVAGRVAQTLDGEETVGQPRSTTLAELADLGGPDPSEGVLLRSQGQVDIRLWLFERA